MWWSQRTTSLFIVAGSMLLLAHAAATTGGTSSSTLDDADEQAQERTLAQAAARENQNLKFGIVVSNKNHKNITSVTAMADESFHHGQPRELVNQESKPSRVLRRRSMKSGDDDNGAVVVGTTCPYGHQICYGPDDSSCGTNSYGCTYCSKRDPLTRNFGLCIVPPSSVLSSGVDFKSDEEEAKEEK